MNRKQRRAAGKPSKAGGSAAASGDLARLFAAAAHHHQAGRLADAEKICRQILAIDPRSIRALHLLGIMALQTRRHDAAADLFARAIAINDRVPELHYNLAFASQALGRREEAAAHYHKAVALKPDFAGAHVNLGNVLVEQNKLDEAAASYRRALDLEPNAAATRYNLANVLARQRRHDDAVAQYEHALALDPNHALTHNNLAIARMEQGDPAAALAHHRRALALDPTLAEAQVGLGNVLRSRGDLEEAVAAFARAVEIRPAYAEAHNNLGSALAASGRMEEAAACYRRALELTPPFPQAFVNLGRLLLAQGAVTEALAIARRALDHDASPEAKSLFARTAQFARFTADDGGFRALMVRALAEGWARPAELARPAVGLLELNPRIRDAVARAAEAWPRRLSFDELLGPGGFADVSGDALLRALLETVPIPDIGIERFITTIRAGLLARAADAIEATAEQPEVLSFCCAIARQCFINEYVFAVTDVERDRVARLSEALVAVADEDAPVPPLWLAALGAYGPLHSVAPSILYDRPWPKPLAALLVQQVHEPREEQALRATLPRLTAIDDRVSTAVKQQYEENPYPRWIAAAPAGTPVAIDDHLREKFPRAAFRPLNKPAALDVLIAGCGTGQHAIETTRQYRGARTLAIDLSLASLAYAKRKTQALRLAGIDYAEADILKLDTIGRSFDVIEASGVLHHLDDPFGAWRLLLRLLRPGGVMNVGLYSELGRRHVVQARAFIAEHGFAATADGIRRCRQEVMASEDALLREVSQYGDFFSTSGCRDLLFHVREHRLTLPQIAAFIAENGLTFLGFETNAAVLKAYGARFPDDPAAADLACWDRFERENPRAFSAMYQFWIQKP